MAKKKKEEARAHLWEEIEQDKKLVENQFEAVPAGMIIVDKEGRIVFFNREAEWLFGYRSEEAIGELVEILLPEQYRTSHPVLRKHFMNNPSRREMGYERNLLACRKDDGTEFPIEVGLGYMKRGDKLFVSAIIIDISRRKCVENECEVLIGELKAALEKVKQLGGMLPICSNCKKIRDDKGYWNQIKSYIRDHSEAEFSHSICPECVEILYPDL